MASHFRALPSLLRGLVMIAASVLPLAAQAAAPNRPVEMAEPAPDWDHPRQIALQITTAEPAKWSGVMSNAINLQKFYGPDHVKLVIVAYGPGLRGLLKGEATAEAAARVASLQSYGIGFVACGNTLDTIGKAETDLLPGVTVVSTGIADLVERTLRGWVVIAP